jgi:NagD protein
MKINDIEGVIFDLDGTLYLGDHALPGAVEVCARLRRLGKRLLFVSNKPLETREAYAAKLSHLGIPASAEEVITSAYVLGSYLKRHEPGLCYYVVGEENLRNELRALGLQLKDDLWEQDAREVIGTDDIQAVIVAFDRTLDYRKLNIAYQALMRGARFFATNADKTCPMPDGAIPDAGAILMALEYITGRQVELVAGKPSSLILQVAMDMLRLPANRCLMVGDRLETDIRMGQAAGMYTALPLTGVTKREHLANSSIRPDLLLQNIGELLDQIL